MLQIIVLLLVAYIIVPLIEMTFAEHFRYIFKVVVYTLTLLWTLYSLFLVGF